MAEFKEFERRFKFKPRFKYGWFHLKLCQMSRFKPALNLNRVLADLNRGSNSLNSISSFVFKKSNGHETQQWRSVNRYLFIK